MGESRRMGGICSGTAGERVVLVIAAGCFGDGWILVLSATASLGWAGGDASLSLAPSLAGQRIRTWRFCSGISPSFSPVMPLTRGASTLAASRAPSSSSRFYRTPSTLLLLLHVFTRLLC